MSDYDSAMYPGSLSNMSEPWASIWNAAKRFGSALASPGTPPAAPGGGLGQLGAMPAPTMPAVSPAMPSPLPMRAASPSPVSPMSLAMSGGVPMPPPRPPGPPPVAAQPAPPPAAPPMDLASVAGGPGGWGRSPVSFGGASGSPDNELISRFVDSLRSAPGFPGQQQPQQQSQGLIPRLFNDFKQIGSMFGGPGGGFFGRGGPGLGGDISKFGNVGGTAGGAFGSLGGLY